jgi:hypothetical protein
VRSITSWINLPNPYDVKVFSLEDLLANKIEGIISGMVARGIITGRVTGRRTIKAVAGLALNLNTFVTYNLVGAAENTSDGSPMALGSTGTHAAWVKLVIPSLGATPLTEIEVPLAGKR